MSTIGIPLSPGKAVSVGVVAVVLFLTTMLLPYVAGRLTPIGMTLEPGIAVIRLASPFFVLVLVLLLFQPNLR